MRIAPLPVRLDRGLPDTLPVQLAEAIRGRIAEQVLTAGDRLPSSRALARDLGVSRSVAEQAYEQLLAEGWLETRHGAGTFVTAGLQPPPGPGRHPAPLPRPPGPALIRLGTGTPWIDPRQHDGWRRAWRDVALATPPSDYPDAAGLPELRAEIAASTTRHRGFVCSPDEVLVTLGTTDGLRHLLGTLPPGAVAVEDPGYAAAVATCRQQGRAVHDVPVDDEGLDVDLLRAAPDGLRAVYVTPAHQHPTGATMSARRRLRLVAEATRRDLLVVEDDYDSEFRYDVAPLPSLAGLDRARVIHLRTTSKAVSPGLRLGWLVAPADLVAEIAERRAATHDVPSWPVQRAWLSMLREGYADKLVRAARRVYRARGERVSQALAGHGRLGGPVAGMYLTVQLPPEVVARVRHDAARAGFDVPSLAETSRSSARSGLVVGFGGITDGELDRALEVLRAALARWS